MDNPPDPSLAHLLEMNFESGANTLQHSEALLDQKPMSPVDTIAFCQAALNQSPDNESLLNQLGVLYQAQGDLDKAEAAFQKALALQPQLAVTYSHLGALYYQQQRFPELMTLYDSALHYHPHHAVIHTNYAQICLLLGHFKRGCAENEWRLQTPDYQTRLNKRFLWQGQPMADKPLLVLAEQGLGDTLQLLRYIPQLKAKSQATLFFSGSVALKRLIQNQPLNITWENEETATDLDASVVFLNSLPHVLGLDTEPLSEDLPYLTLPSAWIDQGRNSVACATESPFKIGIVWSGNPDYPQNATRSFRLRDFEPVLSGLQNTPCQIYSLQKGAPTHELTETAFPIVDLNTAIDDLADTAGILANLDLVITVDTAVAHLAGALQKPVWILLPHLPDWRWQLTGTSSAWYPSARLFRQTSPGDWSSVMQAVQAALIKKLKAN